MGLAERWKDFVGMPEADSDMAYGQTDAPSGLGAEIPPGRRGEVLLLQPSQSGDAKTVANQLKENQMILLNLESAPREFARRFLDFVAGATYAEDGLIRQIATSTYLVLPATVDFLDGDEWDSHAF